MLKVDFVLLNFIHSHQPILIMPNMKNSRRRFIQQTTMAGAGLLVAQAGFFCTKL